MSGERCSPAAAQRMGFSSLLFSPSSLVLGQKLNASLPAGNSQFIQDVGQRRLLKEQSITSRAREEERCCGITVSCLWSVSRLGEMGRSSFLGLHSQKNMVSRQMPYFEFDGQEQAYSTISCSALIFNFGILSSFLKLT